MGNRRLAEELHTLAGLIDQLDTIVSRLQADVDDAWAPQAPNRTTVRESAGSAFESFGASIDK